MSKSFLPGDPTWYASDSPLATYSVVFEDDGETGYVYAYDRAENGGEGQILDACHLYDVRDVVDREIESEVAVAWSVNGQQAALLLNGRAHAVVDFTARQAWCRSNWPPPGGPWAGAPERAPWRDDLPANFTWTRE